MIYPWSWEKHATKIHFGSLILSSPLFQGKT